MALTHDDTLSLLTSEFWIRPVYEELLYAASRFNRSSGAELKRSTSNLVNTTPIRLVAAGGRSQLPACGLGDWTCINIWTGDHGQTSDGLKNTEECRLFPQKLLQSPLALRCSTLYVQPHEFHQVVSQYLDGPCDSPSHHLKLLLEEGFFPCCQLIACSCRT